MTEIRHFSKTGSDMDPAERIAKTQKLKFFQR